MNAVSKALPFRTKTAPGQASSNAEHLRRRRAHRLVLNYLGELMDMRLSRTWKIDDETEFTVQFDKHLAEAYRFMVTLLPDGAHK